MTDGNPDTYDNIRGLPIVYDLGDIFTIDKFTLNEKRGTGSLNPLVILLNIMILI